MDEDQRAGPLVSGLTWVVDKLIHGIGGIGAPRFADDMGGHACNRFARSDRLQNNGAGSNPAAIADVDVAQHSRPGTD